MTDQHTLDYEETKKRASHPDAQVRKDLALQDDVEPEILYYLAKDIDEDVREAIAQNANTPIQADAILVKDPSVKIREQIARKVSLLLPELSENQQNQVSKITTEILNILANDQVVKIRAILANELKKMNNVPKKIIQKLAQDINISVAQPILQYSPLLTDPELLNIISGGPIVGAISAIAGREDLSSDVSEAIIEYGDDDDIKELLNNQSAQIREETLDWIIDQAPQKTTWHPPLVKRPQLHKKAILKLMEFVTESLLTELSKRDDIDTQTKVHLTEVVRRKAKDNPDPVEQFVCPKDQPTQWAKKMKEKGELNEASLREQISFFNKEAVIVGLELLSQVPRKTIKETLRDKNAKALIAMCWKANLSAEFSVQLQLQLAQISPQKVIYASDDGTYNLTQQELQKSYNHLFW